MNKTTIALLPAFALGIPAQAAWTTLDTFENGDGAWSYTSQKMYRSEDPITTEWGNLIILEDPADASNHIGSFDAGEQNDENLNNASVFSLMLDPVVAADSTAATLYFRVYAPTFDYDIEFGLSHLDTPAAVWGDYEFYGRITAATETIDFRSGGGFKEIDFLDSSSWYEVWIVFDNQANSYVAYAKGGSQWGDQTQLQALTGETVFNFRNQTEETIKRLVIVGSTGSWSGDITGRDPLYFDDFYIDYDGENLSTPDGNECVETWAGYCVDETGYISTGDWLGWLYKKPGSNWIYSYALGRYIYFPDPGTDFGGWTYISR